MKGYLFAKISENHLTFSISSDPDGFLDYYIFRADSHPGRSVITSAEAKMSRWLKHGKHLLDFKTQEKIFEDCLEHWHFAFSYSARIPQGHRDFYYFEIHPMKFD